jgi:DHA1 family bicyclomycin/chloramphenicol resistance-like MFS transporter
LFLGLVVLAMTLIFIPKSKLSETKESLSLTGYLPIFKSKPLLLLLTHIIIVIVPYWIFVGISPLLYIKDLGVPLAHFGYYQGIFALIFAIGSVLYGLKLKNRQYNQRKMIHIAIIILIFALISIAITTITNSRNPLLITLSFVPFIISQIIPSTILYPLAINFIPEAKGKVSAIMQGVRLIITALCLQIIGYFYNGTFQNIGIILTTFILLAVITLFFVVNNRKIIAE